MKYIFETEDKEEAIRMTYSLELATAIYEMDSWLRSQIKYHEEDFQEVRDEMHRILEDRVIDLEKILS